MKKLAKKVNKIHTAHEFELEVIDNELDLFRWFLLCYLFGKPIRSETAVATWRLFIDKQLDTPWALAEASESRLVRVLHNGGYTRYQHVTARGIKTCMDQLIHQYEGSLQLMLEMSSDEDEFAKLLKKLYGVGPKITEIFMRETEEYFARRNE